MSNRAIVKATLAMRERNGGKLIGVAVKQGRCRLEHITREGRKTVATPLTQYVPVSHMLELINRYGVAA